MTQKESGSGGFIDGALGHATETVTDIYSKLYADKAFRKETVESFGTGFKVPAVVRTVRKIQSEKTKRKDATVSP
jgi:hypothetical protein